MTHPDPPQGPQDNPWQSGRPEQPSPDEGDQQSPAAPAQGQQPSEADQPTQVHPAIQPESNPSGPNGPTGPQDEPPQAFGAPEQPQVAGQWYGQPSAGHPEQSGQWGSQSSASQPGGWQSQPSANQPGQHQPGQPGQWQSQPSAGQWPTQDSGQWAHNQPPAGQQPGQPGGAPQPGATQQSGPGAFGSAPPYAGGGAAQPPTQPTGYQGGWQQPRPRQPRDSNPIKSAFDFSFTRYATPGLVKIIYILAVIIAALWWIGGTIVTFVAGAAATSVSVYGGSSGGGGGGIFLGFVSLLLGWIPALLWVLFVRVVLEGLMALVRIAEDARGIRVKVDE